MSDKVDEPRTSSIGAASDPIEGPGAIFAELVGESHALPLTNHGLTRHLNFLAECFARDQEPWHALEFLRFVSHAMKERAAGDVLPIRFEVPVPWWVVNAVAERWKEYLSAGPGRTMGEVFSVEGGGQGVSPKRLTIPTERLHRRLAGDVAALLHFGKAATVDAAATHAGCRYGMKPAVILKAWAEHCHEAPSWVAATLARRDSVQAPVE